MNANLEKRGFLLAFWIPAFAGMTEGKGGDGGSFQFFRMGDI